MTGKLATFDIETDPFKWGRTPQPFAIGLYDGDQYTDFWGNDCIAAFLAELDRRRDAPYMLYAHNGGRFDFMYLLRWLQNPVRIINRRIVAARLGTHTLRDSFAILPVPLSASGEKRRIDFRMLERSQRSRHRRAIAAYLKQDCVALYHWVEQFHKRFGKQKLTIASTAIGELKRHHPVQQLGASHDETFRQFYFGGRCQALANGVLRGDWSVFDVNSMYPHVMATFNHPSGREYEFSFDLDRALRNDAPFFADVEGRARGCFPLRGTNADAPLDYPQASARYRVSGHELRAALELGLFELERVHGLRIACQAQNFRTFVAEWAKEKEAAAATGDVSLRLFSKLILNSAYGKFGQNPANFRDYRFWRPGEPWPKGYEIAIDYGDLFLLERDSALGFHYHAYHDVAIAASITGAARALLMRALARCGRPVYCDTDSIIGCDCDLPVSPRLGDWKLEARGDCLALAGRKLYALTKKGRLQKMATKGVNIRWQRVFDIAQGKMVVSRRASPVFSLIRPNGDTFIERKISMRKP